MDAHHSQWLFPLAQHRESRQNHPASSSIWKGLDLLCNVMTFLCVAWRSVFQLACIRELMGQAICSSSGAWTSMWAFPPSLGHWLDLIYLNLLEATNNKDSSLDKHNDFGHWQFLARLIGEVHLLHEASLWRLEKVAVSFSVQTPTQRIRENEETGKHIPNKRTR